jgi:5'-nucleotidase
MKKLLTTLILFLCSHLIFGQVKFNHILITNDDGKEDSKRLFALAMTVKDVANRVSVIVSDFDRSGTSNHTVFGKYKSTFEVTCTYIDQENNIAGYTMPDNPADCVLLGLSGFFGNDRPDLVLSGINSGPNIGPSWFGSGTIGAVRMAAFLGVKAIAFSGFESANEQSFSVIPNWIKAFIASGFIDGIGKNCYLTVGFPRIPLDKIRGIKLAERRISYDRPEILKLKKIHGKEPHARKNTSIWVFDKFTGDVIDRALKYDDYYLKENFIIITAMSIDENKNTLLKKLKAKANLIPKFK